MREGRRQDIAAPAIITSLQNERVKFIRALEMRKTRRETGLFVAEGASILVSARDAKRAPRMLAYQAGTASDGVARQLVSWALREKAEVLEVSEAVLGKLAAKDNPQSMLGVFPQVWSAPPVGAQVAATETWVALEEVRDPGNLGTIMRTAHAVGAAGVILAGTCCDPFSRECVRATMGSIFSVPLVKMDQAAFMDLMTSWPGDVVGTHLSGKEDFRRVFYRGPTLLVMGGEGPGLSRAVADACSKLVKIPMAGDLDSLNLAIATALALYQIRGGQLKI
jgi:RNA methyltransferase, TrmH family